MSEKYCSNCCKNINAATFFLHERMCYQNVKKCPKCNKPFTVDDLEEHMLEAHTEVECEFCQKKFLKSEIDNHKKRCDSKLVPCSYCEMEVLLGELREHQKACGAITEPCIKCNRYIQRKNMDKHLMEGCPPPKNDRRSVDVMRTSGKLSLGQNNNYNNNNYNNEMFNYNNIFNNTNKNDNNKNDKKNINSSNINNNISNNNINNNITNNNKNIKNNITNNNKNINNNTNNNNNNNTNKYNYIPININDYIPDEIFFENDNKKNVDIKIHDNIKKPNLPIRPPSGKKILNEAARKSSSNIGNNHTNDMSNLNNIINNKKEANIKPPSSNITINKINNNTNIKNPQIKKPIRKETEKAKTNIINKEKDKKNDFMNRQNNSNKQAVVIKPTSNKINNSNNSSMNNSRYNFRDNNKKLSSKPNFNISKGNMKIPKEKQSDEEFRRTRDKLTFKEAKNITNKNMNNNNKSNNNYMNNNNKLNKNNMKKNDNKIINDEDYLVNYNFGDVGEDEQIMQQIIEQSLKDQKRKK